MSQVTVIVPSRNEQFLTATLRDVLANARGDIAVYAMLDGYDLPAQEVIDDARLTYLHLPTQSYTQKRHAINWAVELAAGPYIMALDAHCLVAEGFDVVLAENYEPDSVMIPRRHRLDAENWCLQTQSDDRPPIDYEHTMFPLKFSPVGLHGFRWDARTHERAEIPIDETMHFQGSCWFMSKSWFARCGFMQIEGYSGWGQEAEEIGLSTWYHGGRVLTNKLTYYSHLHKGQRYGRGYYMSNASVHACNAYSYNLWVYERRAFFEKFVERFWPIPGWPTDWERRLYDL
jgi:glycosyltransferase involved in cell wall biosynthesis